MAEKKPKYSKGRSGEAIKEANRRIGKKKSKARKHQCPRPEHPAMKYLSDALGPLKRPGSRREYLVEKMDMMFMFDHQAGFDFEDGVWILEREMKSWRVSPRGPTGRYLFQTYIEHKLGEYYGDFDRCTECVVCGKEFRPIYDMEYVKAVLNRKTVCPKCL